MVTRIGESSPNNEGAPQGASFTEPQEHRYDPLHIPPVTAERLANPRQAFYEDWQRWSCREMSLEEQKTRFAAAVTAQVEQADDILAPKIKLAAEIFEWGIFCEPREVLPAGLAYGDDEFDVIVFASDQARWAYADAEPYLKGNQEIKDLIQIRKGYDFRSSMAVHVVTGLPEYSKLVALIADRPRSWQDQPLSTFKKQAMAAAIERDLLAKASNGEAQPAKDLRQHPGLMRSYQRQVQSLDDRVEPQKADHEEESNWQQRLQKRLRRATQANRGTIVGKEASEWLLTDIIKDKNGDDFTCVWSLPDGSQQATLASIHRLGYCLKNEVEARTSEPRFNSDFTYGAWEGLIANAFADDWTATEALDDWKVTASDNLIVHTDINLDPRREAFLRQPFLVLPKLPHGERFNSGYNAAQLKISPGILGYSVDYEHTNIPAASLDYVNFGTQAEIDHQTAQVVGDVRYRSLIKSDYMRLVTQSSNSVLGLKEMPEVDADIVVRTAGVGIADIVGYKQIGRLNDYTNILYQYDPLTDWYQPPAPQEMLVDRKAIADFIGSMGLGIMAHDLLAQPRVETIKDFEEYISWRTTYYKPQSRQQAEELVGEFRSGNWSALLDSKDRVLVQCTVAAAIAGMAIVATSNHNLEYFVGNPLPQQDGAITFDTHRQLMLVSHSRKYIFDPTPGSTTEDAPPDWQKPSLLARFSRRPSWSGRQQMAGVSNTPHTSTSTPAPLVMAAQAPQSQPSIVESVPAVAPLTNEQKVNRNKREASRELKVLESASQQLFALNSTQDFYKTIAKAVPGSKRSKDPLWRAMSLLRKTASEDESLQPVSDDQIKAEITYIHNLQSADKAILTRMGVDRPDPALAAILLASLQRTLQSRQ